MEQIGFFKLQNLLFAQHVSGTIMPIIRSSRFIQMFTACGTWRFGLQVVGLVWSCGLCVWFAGCCSILQNDERYQLDATIVIYHPKYLYVFRASVCPYVHKTTYRLLRTTATTPSAERHVQ